MISQLQRCKRYVPLGVTFSVHLNQHSEAGSDKRGHSARDMVSLIDPPPPFEIEIFGTQYNISMLLTEDAIEIMDIIMLRRNSPFCWHCPGAAPSALHLFFSRCGDSGDAPRFQIRSNSI